MKEPIAEIRRLLRDNPVLGKLPDVERENLVLQARIERFKGPALLNAAHHPLQWLRLVIQGHIEAIARTASGGEVALGDLGPGSWATWIGCFVPTPPNHDFYSAAGSRYLALPTHLVRAAADRCPAIYPAVIAEVGVRMRQLMEWAGDAVLLGPEQRMAKLLHLMARMHGVRGNSGVVQVSQARLAGLSGCSRQTANQLLRNLEKRGLVQPGYRKFSINDMQGLARFIETDADADTHAGLLRKRDAVAGRPSA